MPTLTADAIAAATDPEFDAVEALTRLAASRAPAPVLVSSLAFAGSIASPWDGLAAPFGHAPYSSADQVRNALLEAFAGESGPVRRDLRDAIEGANDATLERVQRLLK